MCSWKARVGAEQEPHRETQTPPDDASQRNAAGSSTAPGVWGEPGGEEMLESYSNAAKGCVQGSPFAFALEAL